MGSSEKGICQEIHLSPMPLPFGCTTRAILVDTDKRPFFTENKRVIYLSIVALV
jgi:hypothetical protein